MLFLFRLCNVYVVAVLEHFLKCQAFPCPSEHQSQDELFIYLSIFLFYCETVLKDESGTRIKRQSTNASISKKLLSEAFWW